MTGYRLPGTIIEDVTKTTSYTSLSTQRIPCFIGVASPYKTVKYEAVVRSSTGLADSLAYSSLGIYTITAVGAQRGLSNYIEGTHWNLVSDQIVWTSSGIVAAGATYYVSYKYVRPFDPDNLTDSELNDYRYKEFTQFDEVVTDLGEDIPDHPLVMICKLALRYYGLPKIAVVQVYADSTTYYEMALELIKYRSVHDICLLNSSSTVRALGVNHVQVCSLPDNGRYRMLWTGAPVGTTIGDETDLTSISGMIAGIRFERVVFVNATRAKYYYIDPITNTEQYTVVDGAFIAAAVAAYRDSFTYPATTLLNKVIGGLTLFTEDYDDYYSEYMLTQAGAASAFVMTNSAGGMKVLDDLTTDNTTVERNNINIITAKDYIMFDVIFQMNSQFRGTVVTNRESYSSTIRAFLSSLFEGYKRNGIIEAVDQIRVTLPSDRRDTVYIYFSYYAVYTHKYTEGELAIVI